MMGTLGLHWHLKKKKHKGGFFDEVKWVDLEGKGRL